MTLTGEYEPSSAAWVREHVEAYERSGGLEGRTEPETGRLLIIVTTRGANSGKIRKFGLMRIEKDGEYALVASNGGAARNPGWYHNLVADPTALMIQDGPKRGDFVARLLEGDEYAAWWNRATGVFPPYADYQANTNRTIPIFLASPRA